MFVKKNTSDFKGKGRICHPIFLT
ncbi:hypothetical protein RB2654_14305 [Rhodobacterales bacterium HTCC2654]|uniref:Uncharacterized protein n=1 Tax=Maritimibacter alkaliphilus HTCC2654 TaxID=314271 RepID=A3VGR0_9RHOB|nr:hypothetical protein RB2654_14305 [Rhodobacterales bacterium HTCC2654] [Maritimibacter alkaliphilus HTCC2654]